MKKKSSYSTRGSNFQQILFFSIIVELKVLKGLHLKTRGHFICTFWTARVGFSSKCKLTLLCFLSVEKY